jgi:hypothetical protein
LKFWAYKSIENCVVCSLYKFVGRAGKRRERDILNKANFK